MTKDELKQEAEEYTKNLLKKLGIKEDMLLENQPKYLENINFVALDVVNVTDAYLAGAEPREKQIEIDAEHIRALQKQNGELTDKVRELEVQNEKLMQMLASSADCETCKHYDEDLEKEEKEPCKDCFFDNSFWELKEN